MTFQSFIETVAVQLLKLAVTELPRDVEEALQRAYLEEESESGKTQLGTILENLEAAKNKGVPMCQDTGIIIFNIEVGSEFRGIGEIEKALYNSAIRATKEIPLRPNAVNPFTHENTGDNTGRNIPFIHWRIVPGSGLNITVMPKGGGSENVCALGMLDPGSGVKGLKKFVIDTIINAGAKPCPPNIVGVAVGGGAEIATKLAKAALLKPLDQPNPDPKLAKLENELLEAANSTGIGPMGLGGKITVLGVRLDYSYRHPASYPVAVAFQCWAARRASAYIDSNCNVKYLSHNVIL